MQAPAEYTFTIKERLKPGEILALQSIHLPQLYALADRYAPQIDISEGVPSKPEYFDLLRTSWLLDQRPDRPPHEYVVGGLGFGFALLLQHSLQMEWCTVEDSFGESPSMVRFQGASSHKYTEVSFPPFSYLEKRKGTQNAEVFCDAFEHVKCLIAATNVA